MPAAPKSLLGGWWPCVLTTLPHWVPSLCGLLLLLWLHMALGAHLCCTHTHTPTLPDSMSREGIEAVEAGAGSGRAAAAAELELPVYCISARDAQVRARLLWERCRKAVQ